jgi:hypothetical protein
MMLVCHQTYALLVWICCMVWFKSWMIFAVSRDGSTIRNFVVFVYMYVIGQCLFVGMDVILMNFLKLRLYLDVKNNDMLWYFMPFGLSISKIERDYFLFFLLLFLMCYLMIINHQMMYLDPESSCSFVLQGLELGSVLEFYCYPPLLFLALCHFHSHYTLLHLHFVVLLKLWFPLFSIFHRQFYRCFLWI